MGVQPASEATKGSSTIAHSGTVPLLVLDSNGKILTANGSARALWQAGETELPGDHFASLFAFEVTSRDSRWLETQWEVLLAAALDAPLRLTALPKDGGNVAVTVRMEKAPAAAGACYLASVQPTASGDEVDLLSLLADRSPAGVFDCNFKTGTFHYSPAWKKQLGYAASELVASPDTWNELLHPEDSAAAPVRAQSKYFNGVRSFAVEYRLRHKQGLYVWIQSAGLQVFGTNGELERVAGVHFDISERKEFEDASIENEERFRELTHGGPLGAFDLNFAAGRFWFSPAWKQLLGYADKDLIDGPDALAGVLHPDDAPAGLKEFFLAHQPGRPAYLKPCRLRHKDGQYLWMLIGVVRRVSRKGELLRVTGFHCALPADLPAGGATALPPASLAGMLAELREGVLLADAGGRVTFVNDKAAALLHGTAEALRGRSLVEAFPLVHRGSGEKAQFPAGRLLDLGEAIALNNEYALPGGGEAAPQPVTWSARPVRDAGGRINGAVVVFRNPDEMSLTPEELIKANRFESLGVLAGGIAHDFNNLLTTILGGISLAKDNRDSSYLEDSEKACLAAQGLTKQLLTFARGGGAVQQVLAPITLLKEATRIAAAGSSTQVVFEEPASVGNIYADRAQILQVFQNLIVNAVQAMPEGRAGHIWLRAGNAVLAEGQMPPLPAGNYVQFEVQDDGKGIPPEIIGKIFDPFFTTKKTGTGLGLATVLDVVRKHGGLIGVNSTAGSGTTFTLFFPQADKPAEVEARRAPTLRFGTGRILFMDDDERICHLAEGMLESLDYKYDVAHNGEEAVKLYQRYLNIGRPYDVVILDLTIVGGMGGEETFKQLLALDPGVRAIVASGYDNEEVARQFIDLGVCGYLTKPYRVTDLGRILKTVLG
ncbi:MAG: hypothetical protein A3G75_03550 [Verrucomicrobia bacterium RIFCSPLOWO2_12_FULL_64_8]|nr:MAG: hypothetical protein A3G75_03550 [Verrucomicrobia bacterium RIFCSPLOWO2_12_FULL_64_8]